MHLRGNSAMSIAERCPIIELQNMGDERGSLIVIEGGKTIPFPINRIFYIYGSEVGIVRGQHANRDSAFVLINIAGKSKVRITDGIDELIVNLDMPTKGVLIPPMYWKDMYDFSQDSVLLVLASTHYNEGEYIRDYNMFLNEIRSNK